MSKINKWWDNLPEHTQVYLEKQPLWQDRDMIYSCLLGFVSGLIIGIAACI